MQFYRLLFTISFLTEARLSESGIGDLVLFLDLPGYEHLLTFSSIFVSQFHFFLSPLQSASTLVQNLHISLCVFSTYTQILVWTLICTCDTIIETKSFDNFSEP